MNIIEREQKSSSIIENILMNRNIQDIDLFLEPDGSTDSDLKDFTKIEDAAKNLIYHIATSSSIGVVVDPDADGYTSSAVLIRYLNDVIKNYNSSSTVNFYMQHGKHHGLTEEIMEDINNDSPDLVLIPDAASNDIDNLLTLSTSGFEVIVIDHHEIEREDLIDIIENVTIINNQRSTEKDKVSKWFTGAGMIYNFIKVVSSLLENSEDKLKPLDDYLDLVAIGQIGDASDISENEIRNIVFKGLKNIKTPFVKSVLKSKSISTERVTPQDLSFSIIPMINSVTRIGTQENKTDLFSAMIREEEDDNTVDVVKRKLNKETRKYEHIKFEMPYTESISEASAKVKTKQDSIVKKTMTLLDKQTDHKQGILIYTMEQLENGSITGLVATKLSRKYDKPALVLLDNGDCWTGSARGIEKVLESFKDWCEDSDLFEFARGHANAFGVSIKKHKFDDLLEVSSKFDATPSDEYEVDKKYTGTVDKKDVDTIISFKHIIGGKVDSPLLGFESIKVKRRNIYTKGQTIEFRVGGVPFVFWGAPSHLFDALDSGFSDTLTLDFIGEPFESNFGGTIKNKVIVRDMSIDDATDDEIFF